MEKIFFTVTGTNYRQGTDFIERGDLVHIVKEPDNKHDKEAIKVEMEGIGLIGYVANSTHTVIGDNYSAGRLYDKIGEEGDGIVRYVLDHALVCELSEHSLDKKYKAHTKEKLDKKSK